MSAAALIILVCFRQLTCAIDSGKAKRIPLHLYKQGVPPKNIKVTKVIPSEDKNKELDIHVG